MARVIGARELALRAQREQEAKQERKVVPPASRPSAVETRPRPPVPRPVPVVGASAEEIVKKLPAGPRRPRKAVPARKRKAKRVVAKKKGAGFDKNDFQKFYMRDYRKAKKLGISITKYRARKK